MVLEDPRNGHGMFGVLLGDHGQIADLEPVVGDEILQGGLVVLRDFVGRQSGHAGGSKGVKPIRGSRTIKIKPSEEE